MSDLLPLVLTTIRDKAVVDAMDELEQLKKERDASSTIEVIRSNYLDKEEHSLSVTDLISGLGEHEIEIPMHLSPGVKVKTMCDTYAILEANDRNFCIEWEGHQCWRVSI